MIEVYKILTGKYDIGCQQLPKIRKRYGRTYMYQREGAQPETLPSKSKYRTAKTWNELPDSVVSAATLNSFKNRLDKHWSNQEIKYDFKAKITGGNVTKNEATEEYESNIEESIGAWPGKLLQTTLK